MNPPVLEVTVLIHKITKDRRAAEYRLHIKKVLNYKHWDRPRKKPKREFLKGLWSLKKNTFEHLDATIAEVTPLYELCASVLRSAPPWATSP